MNEARQKREEFRANLAKSYPEETTFSSKVLEAYDKVHCPELRTIVHFEQYDHYNGVVRLQTTEDGLELWIGGRLRYRWDKHNQK